MLETMQYIVISLVPTDLNEIKLDTNSRKANVSLGMTHGNSSKLIPCFGPVFTDFQTKFLGQTLISHRNMNLIENFVDQNLRSLGIENNLNLKNYRFSFPVMLHSTASLVVLG